MSKFVLTACILWLLLLYLTMPQLVWHPAVLFSFFLSKGLVFYKDFANMHFPLSTFLIFPFYLLSDWNLNIEPLASLIIGILTLVSIFIAARIFLNKWGTIVATGFFSFFYYFASTGIQYSMEQVIGLLLAILLIKIIPALNLKRFNNLNFVILGFFIGLIELSGQIVTLPLAVLFLILVYVTKSLKFTLIGITLSLIPLLLYLTLNNALFEFLEQNIFYYSTYIKLAREGSSLSSLPWNIIISFYIPLFMGIPVLLKRKYLENSTRNIFYLLFSMSAASIPSVVFSVFHPHHFLYILPVNSLLAGLSIHLIFSKYHNYLKTFAIFILSLFVLSFLTGILPWYLDRMGKYPSVIMNDVTPNTSMYNAVEWIKRNTGSDAKILVAGDGLFYFRADRVPSTRLHTVLPWHYKPIENSALIIQKNRPDYWIIDNNYLKRLNEPFGWSSPEISEFIQEEVKNCYKQKASFEEWKIWEKICS